MFTPLEFIEKLSALVPTPRVHLIRYAGAFARHAKIRPHVLVKARMGEPAAAIVAAIMERAVIVKILTHIGISPDIPVVAEARAPPQDTFVW